jgi:beta-N-acetylglucosaminidase
MVDLKALANSYLNPDEKKKKEEQQIVAGLQQMKNKVFGTDEKLAMGKGPVRDNYAKALAKTPTATNNAITNPTNFNNAKQSTKSNTTFEFNTNADANNLGSLDVATELPKLPVNQIADVISKGFPNSTIITPEDAQGIYDAQMETGMSALALLAIAAQESGRGTSDIAKGKNNLWGWNATNENPYDDAVTFERVSEGARDYANKYMNTYYDGYGAKSIYSAGTGNNPSGNGYAYKYDSSGNLVIDEQWADAINEIMGEFYNTAKDSYSNEMRERQNNLTL